MKTEEGLVVEVTGNVAKIKAGRHNDCKNCGACAGSNSIIICALNKKGAIPGQRVEFEVKETNALMAAFMVFMFPLISVLAGVLIGRYFGLVLGSSSTGFEVAGGIVTFILTLICIKLFNNHVNNNEKSQPTILKIL